MKTVSEVMTKRVHTADVDEVVGELRDLMFDERLHAVPVVDKLGALVGIVTSSDLVEEWAPQQGVTTAMSSPVHTAVADTSVVEASQRMLDHQIHHLPVVDGGRVVGMVSSFDLLRAMTDQMHAASMLQAAPKIAKPGDHVIVPRHSEHARDRRGRIVGARGPGNTAPFLVQWLDDPHDEPHEVIFFPGPDTWIEHADNGATPARAR